MTTTQNTTVDAVPEDELSLVVGTPEYILPYLISLREGWLKDGLRTTNRNDVTAQFNIVIMNLELMIERKSKEV